MTRSVLRFGLLLAPLLTGCAADPYERPGTWQPAAHNDANLRAMVADPSHLTAGAGAATSRGAPSALAVDRLTKDRRRPLPTQEKAAPSINLNTGGGSGNGR